MRKRPAAPGLSWGQVARRTAGGGRKGRSVFTAARWRLSVHGYVDLTARNVPCRAGRPPLQRIGEVVDVGCRSGFEGQDQLVTRPIRIAVWTGVTRDTRPKPDMELVGFAEREIW